MLNKIFSTTEICPQRLPLKMIVIASLGAALATASFAGISEAAQAPMILGSFGASCLLMFTFPSSPFSQPRNVIGGHCVATLTGLVFMALWGVHWWSLAMAVGAAVALMLLLRVPHPPAGSNPLIVMVGGVGWSFLLTPTFVGAVVLVLVALLYNNVGKARKYPTYWL